MIIDHYSLSHNKLVRPAGTTLRKMASTRSETKMETMEKMVMGLHDQMFKVQGDMASLTRSVGEMAKIPGEVAALSKTVTDLLELNRWSSRLYVASEG